MNTKPFQGGDTLGDSRGRQGGQAGLVIEGLVLPDGQRVAVRTCLLSWTGQAGQVLSLCIIFSPPPFLQRGLMVALPWFSLLDVSLS